jgi:hypothetical protein
MCGDRDRGVCAVAFNDAELKLIDATVGELCRNSSPLEHRDELRCVYDIEGHAASVFEERPPWDGSPGDWTRAGVARFRYFRSRGEWTLYWMRADLRWHVFDAAPPTSNLAALVAIVEENRYGAFWG